MTGDLAGDFRAARQVLESAAREKVFPAAVAETGTASETLWRTSVGRLTYDDNAPPASAETVFDLASLTKVLATTGLVLEAAAAGTLGLDDPVRLWLPSWRGPDRAGATIRHLLLHASGLPGWLPLYEKHAGRDQYESAIAETPLEYEPATRSVYSDLGFILLGFILEDMGGSLAGQASRLFERLGARDLRFLPPAEWRVRTAPTRLPPFQERPAKPAQRRPLVGEVDDDNAWALGGVSGHAGLFGTVGGVSAVARAWLRATTGAGYKGFAAPADLVREFTRRGNVPGSSRALGWDTMLPGSSCGERMSPLAFGHTGWTGTSVWVDPVRGFYAVLLTNRVHPTPGDDARIRAVRRAFHDALA
ncbi:MAG: serine hydrolase domain-containing protein [Vicinamibacterales bacterium]